MNNLFRVISQAKLPSGLYIDNVRLSSVHIDVAEKHPTLVEVDCNYSYIAYTTRKKHHKLAFYPLNNLF